MKLKLKKDWTLAHFLSYIAAITAVLIGIQLLTQIFIFRSTPLGMDFPVRYTQEKSEQISSVTKDGLLFLPDKQQSGRLIVKEIENRSTFHFYLLAIFKLLENGILIFCAFLVWKIFRSVANNEPFARPNYKRLFIIGWIFVFAEFYAFGRAHYIDWLFFDEFASDALRLLPSAGNVSNFLIVGIVVIVFGYVFKEGHRIHEEQKLTV